MSCKDIALKAVTSLLGHLQPDNFQAEAGSTRLPATSKIPTSLVVRRTTDIPKNSLSDIGANKGRR